MTQAAKSLGGFAGMGPNPDVTAQSGNQSLGNLSQYNNDVYNAGRSPTLMDYINGTGSAQDIMSSDRATQAAAAENPFSGSMLATNQVQNNPILGQLFGQNGELSNSINTEQDLQNQGYSLQPQDVTAYGQAAGNIANLFGQSANNLSQSLADRGLGGASSGAAAAEFSGLNGNKNEQLAQAQTQIANQRMQNTMQRIGQQQNFIGQLGQQGQNAIQAQNQRQLGGVEATRNGLAQNAGLQNSANQIYNQGNLGAKNFNAQNKPENIGDQSITNSNIASAAFAKGLGSMGSGALGGGGG